MFKDFDLKNVLLLFTRQFWAVNSSNLLSILYKLLYCCLYPLKNIFIKYQNTVIKKNQLGFIHFNKIEAEAYLNTYYSLTSINPYTIYFSYFSTNQTIKISSLAQGSSQYTYIGTEASSNFLYLTSKGDEGALNNFLVCNIPNSLYIDTVKYSQFISDLNTMCMTGIGITIIPY